MYFFIHAQQAATGPPPDLIEEARQSGQRRGEFFYAILDSNDSVHLPAHPDGFSTEQSRAWYAGFISAKPAHRLGAAPLYRSSPPSSINGDESCKRDMTILQAAVRAWMRLKLSFVLKEEDIPPFIPFLGIFDIKKGEKEHKILIISFFERAFAAKGIQKAATQLDAFLSQLAPDEKVQSPSESSVGGPKAKKYTPPKVSDVLQSSANNQRYAFKEEILAVYRRENNLPPPIGGSKPQKQKKSADGESDEPTAKRVMKAESGEENAFRIARQSDFTWRDTNEKQLFSIEAYRHTLFLACGLSVECSDPELSFRQLAFDDMTINAYINGTATNNDHKGAIASAENKLQSTFIKAGWTQAAPTPPPFEGFTLIGYKLSSS